MNDDDVPYRVPRLAHGLAFTLWGWCAGIPALGVVLGIAVESLRFGGFRRRLAESDLRRGADVAAVLSLVTLAYFVATLGVAAGLLRTIAWLPVATLPLLLVATISADAPLRTRHLFLSLRNSTAPWASSPAPVDAPFLTLTLLAAAIAGNLRTIFLAGATLVAAIALFAVRDRERPVWIWALALSTALALGAAASLGLARLQTLVEEGFVDWLSPAETSLDRSTTRIGDLGRLKLSDNIVWRITATRAPSLPTLLLETSFNRFDGQSWIAVGSRAQALHAENGRFSLGPRPADANTPNRLRFSTTAAGEETILPLPAGAASLGGLAATTVESSNFGAVRVRNGSGFLRFDVELTATAGRADPGPANPADLSIPAKERVLLQRLADSIAPQTAGTTEKIDAVRRHFADGYGYSLALSDDDGQRNLTRFLTVSRSGHCEYFATATTLLLRALGIPSRYAVGFSLQEFDPATRQFITRRRHAHAWAQALVDGVWIDIDTTPAQWAAVESARSGPLTPLLDRVSWLWHEFHEWSGTDGSGRRRLVLGIALLAASILVWRLWRKPKAPAAASKSVQDRRRAVILPLAAAEADLVRDYGNQCRRNPGETPARWLARLGADGCPGLAPELANLATLHDRYHFQSGADRESLAREMAMLLRQWREKLRATTV